MGRARRSVVPRSGGVVKGWRSLTSNAAQSALDQGLSSGTNFALVLMAARSLQPEDFGAFAIVVAASVSVIALTRSAVGEPVLALLSHSDDPRGLERDALRMAALLGLTGSVVFALLAAMPFHALRMFIGLVPLSPILAIQDASRYLGFGRRTPAVAVISDMAWLAALVPIGLVSLNNLSTPVAVFVTWGASASFGLLAALRALSTSPARGQVLRWLKTSRRLSGWLTMAAVTSQAAGQLTIAIIAGVVGTSSFGGLRAMQALLAPMTVMLVAGQVFLVPRLSSRLKRDGLAAVRGLAARLSIMLAALSIAPLVGAVVFADQIIRAAFGERFLEYRGLVAPLAVLVAAQAAGLPAGAALRAAGRGRHVFYAQLAASAFGLAMLIFLTQQSGIRGAAWAIGAQAVLGVVVTTVLLMFASSGPPLSATDDVLVDLN